MSFSGFGTSFMFLAPVSICLDTFPLRVRGAVIGFTCSFNIIGPTVFGAIYAGFYSKGPLGNFFLLLFIMCVAVNLLSMWILRPILVETDSNMKEGPATEVHSVCFLDDDGSWPADSWRVRFGIVVMKLPAFHILSWCYLFSSVTQMMIMLNITTMATSFGHNGLAVSLPIYGPIIGLLTTSTIGYISDRTLRYVSRLVYVIMAEVLLTLFFTLSIFQGNESHIFSGLVLSSYILLGFQVALIPTLITEYFGSHYFMRISGLEMLINASLTLILSTIVGELYQSAITDDGTECFGLVCFQSTFVLSSVLCAFSVLLCGILWYLERKQAKEYESVE